ncbi:hypothetical protein CBR_g17038 [Chara braunii]|uniref:Sulfurtransferase n=1 Tax=Chara braunii TaxID=69332 RepID=A0A388KUG3_CHABU|nr:hypothetical protein CBR_g17038 [Chara braunii]|eukprot:GBG73696.1 hypothetical protein CBR_g17038 [Chara braunii]
MGPNVYLLNRCHISPSPSTAANLLTCPYPSSSSCSKQDLLPPLKFISGSHSQSSGNAARSYCRLTAAVRSKAKKGRRSATNLDVFPTFLSVFLSAEESERRRRRITKVMAMADEQGGGAAAGGGGTNLDVFPTVSVEWLKDHLGDPDVKVVDASWYLPVEKRDPFAEFKSRRIPGSVFFDLDVVCDTSTDLPHMLPSQKVFSRAMDLLGINNGHVVVVYDGRGIFSAPRLWWMLRVFGHERVAVLEGGLPMWTEKGGDVEGGGDEMISSIGVAISEGAIKDLKAGADDLLARAAAAAGGGGGGGGGEGGEGGTLGCSKTTIEGGVDSSDRDPDRVSGFNATLRPDLVRLWQDVKANVEKGKDGRKEEEEEDFQVVDARPKGRFDGTAPEPRPDVPSGHIPRSKNVPFVNVLTKFEGGCFKDEGGLKQSFVEAGVAIDEPIVAMCGTGVTGCILALALHKLGRTDVAVYDGSWTEWATLSKELGLPIETSVVA